MGEASGKVGRVLTLFLVCCLLQLAAAGRAAALDSLYGALTSRSEKANPFRGISIPPRDELWAASPIRRGRVPPSRRRHLSSHDCGGLLSQLALGFRALRPDAPHPKRDDIVAWTVHVEMETFRDLFWCALKGDLAETLEEIDQLDAKPVPMPYRVNPITHNFSEFSQWARPFQRIRGIIADLAMLALRGHAPASVALAKLSARDDVIRLTPRFVYFLLTSASRRSRLDAKAQRLLRMAEGSLSPEARAEIDDRAIRPDWPLKEPMTLD